MQKARAKEYQKDPNTGDIVLIACITDTDGKPTEETVEIHLSQEGFQKLIREALPTEEQRMQEVLDKIHQIRVNRVLSIEKMDDAIEEIKKNAVKDFSGCTDKIEIMRMTAIYRVKLLASAQKRLLSKFSMQEESELSLQLTKLRQSKS